MGKNMSHRGNVAICKTRCEAHNSDSAVARNTNHKNIICGGSTSNSERTKVVNVYICEVVHDKLYLRNSKISLEDNYFIGSRIVGITDKNIINIEIANLDNYHAINVNTKVLYIKSGFNTATKVNLYTFPFKLYNGIYRIEITVEYDHISV
uniref:Uncharacterized protein n=1 Tax=Pithovirus LCDPAC01 TaxID=2506600 RepID=A0A481YMA4_9VIRU|nr:MAG: hypothetical protein LCDPAC01_00160 [Pithovirus LCDPAC01]